MKKIKILSKILGILSIFMLTCLPFNAMENDNNTSKNIKKININKDSLEKIDNLNKSENKLNDLFEEKNSKNNEKNNVKSLNQIDDNQPVNINKINIDKNSLEKQVISLVEQYIDLNKYKLPNIKELLNSNFNILKESSPKDYITLLKNIIKYFKYNRPKFIKEYGEKVEIEFFKRRLFKDHLLKHQLLNYLNDPIVWNTLKTKILERQVIKLYNQYIDYSNYIFLPNFKTKLNNCFSNIKKTSPEEYIKILKDIENYFLNKRSELVGRFGTIVESKFFSNQLLKNLNNLKNWVILSKKVITELEKNIKDKIKSIINYYAHSHSSSVSVKKRLKKIFTDNFDCEKKETHPRQYIMGLANFWEYLNKKRNILINKYGENVEGCFFRKHRLKDINNEKIWEEFSKEIKKIFEEEEENIMVNINNINKMDFKLSSYIIPEETIKAPFTKHANLPKDDFSINLPPKKDIKLKNRSLSLDNLKNEKNNQIKIDFSKMKFDDKIKNK